jgi:hypothetical protein
MFVSLKTSAVLAHRRHKEPGKKILSAEAKDLALRKLACRYIRRTLHRRIRPRDLKSDPALGNKGWKFETGGMRFNIYPQYPQLETLQFRHPDLTWRLHLLVERMGDTEIDYSTDMFRIQKLSDLGAALELTENYASVRFLKPEPSPCSV